MTEWANGMSTSMWAGYSAAGGQVSNPYGDYFVGGSSSGSAAAIAANLASLAVGTETSASILSPSIQNSIVGIKPTVGLVSRSGIIPFSHSQDTAGAMARSVADAAILLGVLAGRDECDPSTWRMEEGPIDYTPYLQKNGLEGMVIGVYRGAKLEQFRDAEEYDDVLFNQAVESLSRAGAVIIDHIEIPSFHREWPWSKLNYEFKTGLEQFLQTLPSHLPVHSLKDLIAWNEGHKDKALKYGQDLLQYRAGLMEPLRYPDYINGCVEDLYFSQDMGIDYAIDRYGLDVILFPSYVGADLSARAGYPSIAVPAGYREDNGRPFGLTFTGKAYSEPKLIRTAYAYEQLTLHRRKPCLEE